MICFILFNQEKSALKYWSVLRLNHLQHPPFLLCAVVPNWFEFLPPLRATQHTVLALTHLAQHLSLPPASTLRQIRPTVFHHYYFSWTFQICQRTLNSSMLSLLGQSYLKLYLMCPINGSSSSHLSLNYLSIISQMFSHSVMSWSNDWPFQKGLQKEPTNL